MNGLLSSSSFLSPSVLHQTSMLRKELDVVVKQQISGQAADVSAHLKGDFTAITAMDNELKRLQGFSVMIAEASIWAEMMGSALDVINSEADSLLSRLTVSSAVETRQQLEAITADGASSFENIIATLNTRSSDRALFSGSGAAQAPLPPAKDILDALSAELVGVSTAQDVLDKIEAWFSDADGFESLYQGGAPRAAYAISLGEGVDLGITAIDPALRGTLAGVAVLALIDKGLLEANSSEQFSLLKGVTQGLSASSESRSHLTSRLGVAQERIEKAQARNATTASSLHIARAELVEIDPYETAIKLKDLESKLEAFYTVLSRLSNLSLVNYLR